MSAKLTMGIVIYFLIVLIYPEISLVALALVGTLVVDILGAQVCRL